MNGDKLLVIQRVDGWNVWVVRLSYSFMHEQGECIIVGLFALKVGPNIAILILIFFSRVVFSPS